MSQDPNHQEINKITSPIIKGERPVYYLITEEKLSDLVTNSFVGSVFFAIFSIFEGAALKDKNGVYAVIGILFLLTSIYFYWLKIKFIRKTKKSGEVQSFKYEAAETKNSELKIVKAIYGTPPNKIMDATDTLNNKIADNKLSFTLLNEVIGGDPDKGVNKVLDIEYKIGNEVINKRYKEYEHISLP